MSYGKASRSNTSRYSRRHVRNHNVSAVPGSKLLISHVVGLQSAMVAPELGFRAVKL